MSSVIIIRGTGTGNADSVASIDVPMDGMIMSAWMTVAGALNADGEFVKSQISFGSTYTNANDARQVVYELRSSMGMLTTGASSTTETGYIQYANGLPVGAGERIYLHVQASTGVGHETMCGLVFSFDEARPSVRRR